MFAAIFITIASLSKALVCLVLTLLTILLETADSTVHHSCYNQSLCLEDPVDYCVRSTIRSLSFLAISILYHDHILLWSLLGLSTCYTTLILIISNSRLLTVDVIPCMLENCGSSHVSHTDENRAYTTRIAEKGMAYSWASSAFLTSAMHRVSYSSKHFPPEALIADRRECLVCVKRCESVVVTRSGDGLISRRLSQLFVGLTNESFRMVGGWGRRRALKGVSGMAREGVRACKKEKSKSAYLTNFQRSNYIPAWPFSQQLNDKGLCWVGMSLKSHGSRERSWKSKGVISKMAENSINIESQVTNWGCFRLCRSRSFRCKRHNLRWRSES